MIIKLQEFITGQTCGWKNLHIWNSDKNIYFFFLSFNFLKLIPTSSNCVVMTGGTTQGAWARTKEGASVRKGFGCPTTPTKNWTLVATSGATWQITKLEQQGQQQQKWTRWWASQTEPGALCKLLQYGQLLESCTRSVGRTKRWTVWITPLMVAANSYLKVLSYLKQSFVPFMFRAHKATSLYSLIWDFFGILRQLQI